MKVLFTHSYFLHFDQKQLKLSKPYPPLATILAASLLRENGFDVSLVDTNFETSSACIHPALDEQPDVLVIYDDGFNYLSKMCLTNMREAAFEMIEFAKKKGIHVIVSSSDSTDHFADYLEKGADEIILGEADQTLLELVKTLKSDDSLHEVPGIVYKGEDTSIKSTPRKIMKELDELPLPAWDLIDFDRYKQAWSQHGYFSLNIATTRGCPFKCNWCAKPIYGNRYNSRSPQHVVNEIKLMQSLVDFDHIWFCDDIFGLKPNWVQEFNEVLKKEGIKIPYKIQSRADLLVKDDTIIALAESGCDEVWIGAESGSQKILDAMDKGTSIEQIFESTRLMKKHGIKPCFFLQFGYTGETWEDIQSTLNMVFNHVPYDIGVSVSYPLPGTKFYDSVKSQLKDKQNWEDSDELLLMYQSTFSPKFYKKLHRYLHKKFRQKQLFAKLKKGQLNVLPKWGYFLVFTQVHYVQVLMEKGKIRVT